MLSFKKRTALEIGRLTGVEWLLLILKLADGCIDGLTRLQKLAFLIANRVEGIMDLGFFNDWKADRYGPFSRLLSECLTEAQSSGLIQMMEERIPPRYKLTRVILTSEGLKKAEELRQKLSQNEKWAKVIEKMRKILSEYKDASLLEILYRVYYEFPSYAEKSEIKEKVSLWDKLRRLYQT